MPETSISALAVQDPDMRDTSLLITGKTLQWGGKEVNAPYTVSPSDFARIEADSWDDLDERINKTLAEGWKATFSGGTPDSTSMDGDTITASPEDERSVDYWSDRTCDGSEFRAGASMLVQVSGLNYTGYHPSKNGTWTVEPILAVERNEKDRKWVIHSGLRLQQIGIKDEDATQAQVEREAEDTLAENWALAVIRDCQPWQDAALGPKVPTDAPVLQQAHSQLHELGLAIENLPNANLKRYKSHTSQMDTIMTGIGNITFG